MLKSKAMLFKTIKSSRTLLNTTEMVVQCHSMVNDRVSVAQHSSAFKKDERLGSDKKCNKFKMSDHYTAHNIQ